MNTYIITATDGTTQEYDQETQTAAIRAFTAARPSVGVLSIVDAGTARAQDQLTDAD